MTGFGTADGPVAGGRVQVDIRTVNHKHFNVQARMASALQPYEDAVRSALRARIERGHISISIRWTEEPKRPSGIAIDVERARAITEALEELRDALDLPGEIDLGFVARQPEVLRTEESEAPAVDAEEVVAIVEAALALAVGMRAREGAALGTELHVRLDAIETQLDVVRERAPHRVVRERDRLRAAVRDLLDGATPDEQRIAHEIAILADRLDITEELVRLETHLGAARAAITGDGPAGRTLGFLSQEMLREINTIGSKANDAEITQLVITMKAELDKFREQLENVE